MVRAIILAFIVAASPAVAQTVSLKSEQHVFLTEVILNDQVRSRALIDTGATSLSICEDMAKTLGLTLGSSLEISTSAGRIPARRAVIDSIRIGAIEIQKVSAVVKPNSTSCDEVLVGMSVLRMLASMTLRGDTLTLVGPPSNPSASRPARMLPAKGEREISLR